MLDNRNLPTMDPIEIMYRFQMEGGREDVFALKLDPASLQIVNDAGGRMPAWTALEVSQCENCPLDAKDSPECPAAVNMVRLVQRFDTLLSFDEAKVTVVTGERKVYGETTIQRAVCSLMGLLMAASDCPLMDFFKPMARFHLPFASTAETIWRATSAYLMAQYFHKNDGAQPDIHFEGLSRNYEEIQNVNLAFAKRLRQACRQDSMINAIVLLDMFAQSMPTAIDESLEEIRHLFVPFLRQHDGNKSVS
jgi:hypothetical protein